MVGYRGVQYSRMRGRQREEAPPPPPSSELMGAGTGCCLRVLLPVLFCRASSSEAPADAAPSARQGACLMGEREAAGEAEGEKAEELGGERARGGRGAGSKRPAAARASQEGGQGSWRLRRLAVSV